MEKMDGKTMDIVAENVGKLKEMFPEAFTEDGSYGTTKDTKIDFEVLKELLGEYVNDKDERYSFTWNGKSKARMIAQTPSTGTLRPCKEESVDWDSTQNIFIEGDNLEVLKLLQKSYHKKVKMIYIDPPYNTGNDFVYKDNFKDNIKNYKEITGQVDGEGRNLSNNPETSGRYHTDWLNMMYPRLKLARNLLKDDGVIFISIDDNEVSNLRKMCDEIFGEENFVSNIIWQKKYSPQNDAKYFSDSHEHILLFAKNIEKYEVGLLPRTKEANARYKNPDNDPRGPWKSSDLTRQEYRPNDEYGIINPANGKEFRPPAGNSWGRPQKKVEEMIENNQIWFGPNGDSVPSIKRFLSDVKQGITPQTIWMREDVGDTQEGKKIIKNIFQNATIFETPKPPRLIIRELVTSGASDDELILDFFAGSSSTAYAVMQFNMDSKNRLKFLMVQLPEAVDEKSEAFKAGYKTIAEISKERIRRSATKIKEENPDYDGDLGFKVFKLDSTNIKPWEVDFDMTERTLEDFISNIKTDRREEDVLYEILLKYGLDLTLPIDEWIMDNGKLIMKEKSNSQLSTVNSQLSTVNSQLSTVNSQLSTVNSQLSTVNSQLVYSIGRGALIICLSDDISLEVVQGIAKLKDKLNPEIMRVVFKDSGFKDDVVKTNAVQILKQAGIVDVRSL